jgi:hypothetical protein
MYLREIGLGGWCRVDPVGSEKGQWWALVNMVMNLRVLVPQSYFVTLFNKYVFQSINLHFTIILDGQFARLIHINITCMHMQNFNTM